MEETMLERLRRDHDRIRELAALLAVEFDRPEPGDMALLAALRWDMASTIMTHLAYEDRHLYARLAQDPNPAVADLAQRFQAELRNAFTAYCEHAREWTPERIASEWNSYRAAALAFNSWLLVRAMREEADLYPLYDNIQVDVDMSALATNWASDAPVIHHRIVGDMAA